MGRREGRLGAAAVAAVGLRRRETGEPPPPEGRGKLAPHLHFWAKKFVSQAGGAVGPLPAPPGLCPRLTASGSRFRGSGQTGKLTPLLLRLELGELEAALALESDGGAAAAANTIERWLTPRLSPNTRRPAPAPRANQSHTMEGRLGPAPAPPLSPRPRPSPRAPVRWRALAPPLRTARSLLSAASRRVCTNTKDMPRGRRLPPRRPPAPVPTPARGPRTPTLLRAHTSSNSRSLGLGRRGGSAGEGRVGGGTAGERPAGGRLGPRPGTRGGRGSRSRAGPGARPRGAVACVGAGRRTLPAGSLRPG